jgi:hypothetical protein
MATKITFDLIVDTIIQIHKERNYHEDFQNINNKKIELLNKYLFEGVQNIKFENNQFILTSSKRIIEKNIFSDTKEGFHYIDFNYVNYCLNDILNKLNEERLLCKGELTTTNAIINFQNEVNINISNRIIKSHQEQIIKEYKELIKNIIIYTFWVPFSKRKDNEIIFHINSDFSEEDEKIFFNQLDEYDYI